MILGVSPSFKGDAVATPLVVNSQVSRRHASASADDLNSRASAGLGDDTTNRSVAKASVACADLDSRHQRCFTVNEIVGVVYPISSARDAVKDVVCPLGVQEAGRVVHYFRTIGISVVVAWSVVDCRLRRGQ